MTDADGDYSDDETIALAIQAFEIGLVIFVPSVAALLDFSPSSEAISRAFFNPREGTVALHFRNGEDYVYPCSAAKWAEYRAHGSKGGAFNAMFRGKT